MDNISKTCLLPNYLLYLPTQKEEIGVHELFLSSCLTVTSCPIVNSRLLRERAPSERFGKKRHNF